jgi:hypothetical protein
LRAFVAQPAPALPVPDSGPESGTYPKGTYPQPGPQGQPDVGGRFPRIFVIPLNPLVAAAVVFGIIYFWLDNDALPWMSEMNPITRAAVYGPSGVRSGKTVDAAADP